MHFTGKQRDNETGLDYFGARYNESTIGRFMTPDPLLNSGRPWDPQTWNRYAYTVNNPLSFTDPTGLYDWGKCVGNNAECDARKKRFTDAVNEGHKLLKGLDPKSKEAKAISKALNALGSENDKNGVKVDLGPTKTGAPLDTIGSHVEVNFAAVDEIQRQWNIAMEPVDSLIDDAANELHEGYHIATNNKRQPINEVEAYTTSSYVSEAGDTYSTAGVWNPRWASGPDKESLRQQAIKAAALRSENVTKAYEEKRK